MRSASVAFTRNVRAALAPTRLASLADLPALGEVKRCLSLMTKAYGKERYFSRSRGMISTKLQGLWRMSSWNFRMPSQPSFTAPVEPGRAKR